MSQRQNFVHAFLLLQEIKLHNQQKLSLLLKRISL
jgi:hypothetical protein